MAELVLGPMLRWADRSSATVWVETDRGCTVTVLGADAETFEVAGHHYALVVVDLDGRDEVTPYDVRLDGEVAWPQPDDTRPAPAIRKPASDAVKIVFGSCRAAAPDREPWTLPPDEHPDGIGPDALVQFGRTLEGTDHAEWPDLLLMLGDQVYADAASPRTREFAASRRDVDQPPGADVADFEEYTRLYRESWEDPEVRWLLSTVPCAMVFDDHDVIDDWNISASWLQEIRATDWWHDRIVGALASYWVYQHLGNLSPAELEQEPLLGDVCAADGDAAPLLWAFAEAADHDPTTTRWSFSRRLGDTDVVVVDSRAARVLGEGRSMLDDAEWEWLADALADPAPHVLVATSLPVLLPTSIHDLEGWNARVCAGAWGPLARRPAEAVRRAIDLEHWAAFGDSFERIMGLLRGVAANPDVRKLVLLSGDVHNGSVDQARWDDVDQPLWQVVASPMRQGVEPAVKRVFTSARTAPARTLGRVLRALSGGTARPVGLRTVDGPVFSNHLGIIDVTPDATTVRLLATDLDRGLRTAVERTLR